MGQTTATLGAVALAGVGYVLFGNNDDVVAYGSFSTGGPERVEGTIVTDSGGKWTRRDVYFYTVDGSRCHGWFYRPSGVADTEKLPIVVMASGLGAQIDFGMDKYAERFASSGSLSCLLFDYRGFGSSEGDTRNFVDPWRHLDDWRSALAFTALPAEHGGLSNSVDVGNVALWGSSMSGGHVLTLQSMLAAEKALDVLFPALQPLVIKAVVAQTPHLDGRENRKKNMMPVDKGGRGISGALRIARTALQDMARSALQGTFAANWVQGSAYVPIVGKIGQVAMMPLSEEELANYFRKHPASAEQKGGGWRNMCPARVALKVGAYSPIDYVPGLTVPVLLVAGARDSLCPAAMVAKAAKLCQASLVTLDAGHFEMYYDDKFDAATSAMLKHLLENLKTK